MKVSTKIMGLVFIVIILLLAISGYFSIRREIQLFDSDMRRDAQLLGDILRDMFVGVWQQSGHDQALQLIQDINEKKDHIKVRFVPFTEENQYRTSRPRTIPEPVKAGESISIKKAANNGIEYLFTYIPIKIENENWGALVLSESLTTRNAYIHESVIRLLILAGILLLASGCILWIVGVKFVGKPLQQLVEKTQRIGESGDLAVDLVVYGHDELSDLTIAMNRMCEQLAQARETATQETEKRIAAIEQLRHADRLATLGRLSSGIAHELGTPLNVVAGRAKMIAVEKLEREEITEFAQIIREQAERMTKIIRQLLDFARRRAVQRSPVDIVNLSRQVLNMLKPIAQKSSVTLELIEISDIQPVSVDQAQIQQVFINLIMNGIQAMPDGGRLQLKLNLEKASPPFNETEDEKEYLTICITDEGSGISEDDIKHIFEPFFTTKGTGKGTGLGLSIAHGIVEEHGGWIDVENEPGKGACFTIYIPTETTV